MPETLRAGSVFGFGDATLIPLGESWESVGSGSFALAVGGDSVIVYCLNEGDGDYHHLGALMIGRWSHGSTWGLSARDSQLPEELDIIGGMAIAAGWDNVLYVGPTSGTRSDLLDALADASNWEGSNSEHYVYAGDVFEIDGGKSFYSEHNNYVQRGELLGMEGGENDGAVTSSGFLVMASLATVLALIHL